jgi:hypothetical protein
MNRGALRARLQVRLRIPPAGDPLLSEPVLNDCIAQALADVSSYNDWPWLLTSGSLTFVAGSAALPTDLVKARDLVINSYRARPASMSEFLDNGPFPSLYLWCVIGANVQLSPVPVNPASPTNTFYYIRPEPALTADTQSPLMPEAHQSAVISRAAYHACIAKGMADAASVHNAEFETDLRRMNDATKRVTRPRQIRTVGFERWATW